MFTVLISFPAEEVINFEIETKNLKSQDKVLNILRKKRSFKVI